MEIISHANVLPWLVEPSFFMRMLLTAVSAVLLSALVGLAYAGLRRLLYNGVGGTGSQAEAVARRKTNGGALKCASCKIYQKGVYDEA